jgi:diguanylate cyclase (GGDEF)-like protein
VRAGVLLGLVIFLPAGALALRAGDYPTLIVSVLAYGALLGLRAAVSLSGRALHASLSALLFLLGVFASAHLGSLSSGEAWFCAATMIAAFAFGARGAVLACGAQGLVLAAIGIAQAGSLLPWHEDALGFARSALAGLGADAVIALAQIYVLRAFRSSVAARSRLSSELNLRQAELKRESACREDAEQRVDFLVRHDHLTRLPNREYFEIELARALDIAARRGRILGVMAVGLDRFSRVAELHGPSAGDSILVESAERLTGAFRDGDLVARTNGEAFLVLLSDVKSPEDAKAIIEKSRRAFDRSFTADTAEIGISASCGLALYPHDGESALAMIRAAEAALLLAKRDGPGSHRLYDAALHQRLIEAMSVERELRGALTAEAFLPWYQPKVDALGRIVGVEALARWRLPGGRFRLPIDFISTAERSGVIVDLGRAVLAKACSAAAAWERKGLQPIPVSVNLSPFQFRGDDLVKDVRRVLGATGLPAARLDLEITESGIMEDQVGAIEKLAELKALGCSISIDDFGTGYSSFSTLRDYPVDMVKLPQSFVTPLPTDERATAIAGAVIDLAHKLSFSVVAEGVENRLQFAWLGAASCDQYQGYLFAPPMPQDEFEDALANGLGAAVE